MPVPNPRVVPLRELLAVQGISLPVFPQLVPDAGSYNVALLQPGGDVTCSATGVTNVDQVSISGKVRGVLALAIERNLSLCVTPEYSCPWTVVDDIVAGTISIPEDAIWVLGCEAISIPALLQREAGGPQNVKWVFEPPEPNREGNQSFLDPVCIITRGVRDSESILIVAVQFKTEPMGGTSYEQQNMIRGSVVYELKNPLDYSIRLVCLLCSDVLQCPGPRFVNLVDYLSCEHRVLLLHLQMNPEPRHDLCRPSKELVLRRDSRQVVALNWSKDIRLLNVPGNAPTNWVPMSAIYSRTWKKGSLNHEEIDRCEQHGLYFCYSESLRSTVAVLNFREYVFIVTLSKVCQASADGHHQTYSPPQADATLTWDSATNRWVAEILPLDTEAQLDITSCGLDTAPFGNIFERPNLFERLGALSVGEINSSESSWPQIDAIKASSLDHGETVYRTTFAQDLRKEARQFRRSRYQKLQRFNNVRILPANFPRQMSLFSTHEVKFDYLFPYSNLRVLDGRRGTAVYLHDGNENDAKLLYTRIQKHLPASSGEIDKDHVVIWYQVQDHAGIRIAAYPPEVLPQTTDHPSPAINAIKSQP